MQLISIPFRPRLAVMVLTTALASGSSFAQVSLPEVSTVSSISNTLQQVQPSQRIPTVPSTGQATPSEPAASPASTAPARTTPAPIVVPQSPSGTTQSANSSANKAATQTSTPQTGLVNIVPLTPEQQQMLEAAQASLKAGEVTKARAQFEALIVANFNNPEPHFGLALALYRLNDLRGAAFEFTQFTLMSPQRYEGPYNLGVIATREGRYADALQLYQGAVKLIENQKVSSEVRLQLLQALAIEQARAKTYGALGDTYDQILKILPEEPRFLYRAAQARFLAQQYEAALPATYAVLQVQPNNLEAALLLADIYAAQGLIDRAIRELAGAAERAQTNRDKARLHYRRAELLAAKGVTRDALQAVQEASKLDPNNAAAFALEGKLLNIREERARAVEAYRAALRLDLSNAGYRTELAAIRLTLGQNAEAAIDAQQAIALKPEASTLARAQYILGVAQYRQKKFAEAKRSLNASQISAPSADTALWLGMTNFALKDYNGAVSVLSEAIKLQGNAPSTAARQNLAASLLALGRYDEAASLLAALTAENEKNADAWYLLGLTRRAAGNEVEAKSNLKRAAELGDARAKEALK